MNASTLLSSFLLLFLFVNLGQGAALSRADEDSNVEALRGLTRPSEAENILPQKRDSTSYLTNLKAKYYDSAAWRRMLKTMYVGKRTSDEPRSDRLDDYINEMNEDAISSPNILIMRLDDPVVRGYFRELAASLREKK